MSSRPFLLALLCAAQVGCLGSYGDAASDPDPDPDPGPGGATNAKATFTSTVSDAMKLRCFTCHGANASIVDPDFLGANESSYYSAIETYTSPTACPDGPCMITFPDQSILVTKGVHAGGSVGWWSESELQAVRAWLTEEVDVRGLDPPADPCLENPALPECGSGGTSNRPLTVPDALQRFADCMDYDLWLAGPGNDDNEERYNVALAWANSSDGLCNGCHNVASDAGYCPGGSCLFTDSWMTFDAHRRSPSLLKLVLPVTTTDGIDLVQADRYVQKGYEGGGTDHPSFELRAECSAALQQYVEATLTRYHDYATPCTPATPPQ